MRVDVWAQTDLWQFLKGQKDAYRSVLSNNPKDYPSDRALVQDKTSGALGSSFKYSAGEGVERWPIPVIIFGPPRSEGRKTNIGSFITTNRQEASLSQHILLSAQTVNVDNPQAQIDYLFDFFDRNPTVPEVLIYDMDGLAVRSWFYSQRRAFGTARSLAIRCDGRTAGFPVGPGEPLHASLCQ
ncbi:MAG: unnamed protein product [uncultured Paraburkholderia sp.]|nr:MAG: unnamed protein product [uncultured Paraburkholderia sp.]CAH2806654.1 MAG: unnamed protein product [uncultured Paraburkholderia sp.]CAH2943195.1 MAG: unnamed protein product [uncultured Paraburkholderia sp.]